MRIYFVCKGALVAAMFCLAPAALLASPKAGQPGARAVEFNKVTFPNDISSRLRQIQSEAYHVKNNADQLQAQLREGSLDDWKADAVLLDSVSAHVNRMNKLLSYLRAHKAEASPLQRKVIEHIAPASVELANTTQDAIVTLQNNETHVYMTDLDGLANDIYMEASRVDQTLGNLEKYLDAHHEEQPLKQTLGLKNKS